ncbi:MAG: exonuclease subunit SbcD [Saprospiraceae bacterium]
MKILHTADWHIGKVLHKHSLGDEMTLFFDWLIDTIKEQNIDLLLVSGDIFDTANPSVLDRKLYYKFLSRLIGTATEVIITGGNHDSIHLIDAPHDILKQLKVTVIGGARENKEEELIEIYATDGTLKMVVAAVPFLRDKDLLNLNNDIKYENKTEAIREGIKQHYTELATICKSKYEVPIIAMGHLYARGVTTSESERDIHIGNAAAIDSSIFSEVFDYVALGHIHRPQIIGNNEMIRYSGSPIALSFSEKEDKKCVLILEMKKGEILSPKALFVPKWRALKKITGDFDTIVQMLEEYNPQFDLVSFVEIEVREKNFSVVTLANIEDLVSKSQEQNKYKILKHRPIFEHGVRDTSSLFEVGANIEELSPKDVFNSRIEQEEMEVENMQILNDAFQEILESIQSGEK